MVPKQKHHDSKAQQREDARFIIELKENKETVPERKGPWTR